MAKSPDFDALVKAYKDRYGVDLSHMSMRWSKHPVYNNGKRSYEFDDDETGGSWVGDSTVRINPNMGPVMKRFGIEGMTQREFRRRLIAHELAHEIWRKQHDEKKELIKKILLQAKAENFTTPYLPTVAKHKLDEETFAEYMSDQLNKKAQTVPARSRFSYEGLMKLAQAYDPKKWPDYDEYQAKNHDKKIELVERLVREHYAKQHPWGAKTTSGKFLKHEDVRNANRDDVIVRGGDSILRQRRGTCHELSNARMKLLKLHGINGRRMFAFYGVGQDNDGLLGHSFVFFEGDDGKWHFASPHMQDRPRKNFGSFDNMDEAIQQYMAAVKGRGDGGLTDDDYVEIHDTTDMKIPDKMPFRNFVRTALKQPQLYVQGK